MRHGGTFVGRGRALAAGVATAALVGLGVAAGVPLLREHSQQRLEQRAEREVTATAQRARTDLLAAPDGGEAELRRVAAGVSGVEVLSVQRNGSAGTRLVFRVRVDKTASSVFGWQRAESSGCFAQLVRGGSGPAGLERLPCPD